MSDDRAESKSPASPATTPAPVRLAVAGISGRMGQRIARLAAEMGCVIVCATDRPDHPKVGKTLAELGILAGSEPGSDARLVARLSGNTAQNAEVCLDFSSPDAVGDLAQSCQQLGIPFVSGTTGVSPTTNAKLQEIAATIAVMHATNFSLGVALLNRLAEDAIRALGPDFVPEIVEFHHSNKADSPSGTALTLRDAVARARRRLASADEDTMHGRAGLVGPRDPNEIGMHAVRGGSVVGDHTLHLLGPDERLELTHRAASRDIFVRGALRACRWIRTQRPGLYSVEQMLFGD